jgi:hypothetical protein
MDSRLKAGGDDLHVVPASRNAPYDAERDPWSELPDCSSRLRAIRKMIPHAPNAMPA